MALNKITKILFGLSIVFLVLFAGCSKQQDDTQNESITVESDNGINNTQTQQQQVDQIVNDELATEDVEIGELI